MTREETLKRLERYSKRISAKTNNLYFSVNEYLRELIVSDLDYNTASRELNKIYTEALKRDDFFGYFKNQTTELISDVSYSQAVLGIVVASKQEYREKIQRIALFDDDITLSMRIRTNYNKTVKAQREILNQALKAGNGVKKIARQINEVGGFDPEIPKYIRQLERLKFGGEKLSESTLRSVRKQIGELKTKGLKQSYNRLVNTIVNGGDIDKAISNALQAKARSFANRLAKSEAINTQAAVKVARWANNPLTKWIYSKTTGSHPCNFCKTMEAFGKFPFESAPSFIYHSNCSCTLHPVYSTEEVKTLTQSEYESKFISINKEFGKTYVDTTPLRNLRENTIVDKLGKVA